MEYGPIPAHARADLDGQSCSAYNERMSNTQSPPSRAIVAFARWMAKNKFTQVAAAKAVGARQSQISRWLALHEKPLAARGLVIETVTKKKVRLKDWFEDAAPEDAGWFFEHFGRSAA